MYPLSGSPFFDSATRIDIYRFGWTYLKNGANKINDMHDYLFKHGFFQAPGGSKVVLDDLFKDGHWLDTSKIPIISGAITTTELTDYIFNFFHASLLNYSWRNSLVYVVGHPMTKSECKRPAIPRPGSLTTILDSIHKRWKRKSYFDLLKLTFCISVDDVFEKMDDNLKTWHDGRGYFLQRFEANFCALTLPPKLTMMFPV